MMKVLANLPKSSALGLVLEVRFFRNRGGVRAQGPEISAGWPLPLAELSEFVIVHTRPPTSAQIIAMGRMAGMLYHDACSALYDTHMCDDGRIICK